MKKLVFILIAFLMMLPQPTIAAGPALPPVSAETAALIDVATGRILAEKQADRRMRIASLTKIMTAIVALEEGNSQDIVTTPNSAYGKEGSSIYLKRGEKMKMEDMLYGLMLRSGNDAAVAIAEHVGGSIEGFARLMNEKAEYIGMHSSHFTNPHGLDDSDNHYSTARDMALLTAYALRNPEFRKIVSTQVKYIPWEEEQWDRKLVNKNKMLRLYKGADGVKTGYTKLAKRCLSSSATRNGQQLAVVVLNAPQDWEDSMKWLDYGFSQFPRTEVIRAGERVGEDKREDGVLAYYTKQAFSYPLSQEEKSRIEKQLVRNIRGPFLEIRLDGKLIGRVALTIEQETVAQAIGNRFTSNLESFFRTMLEGM
ncbi:D-alanyl-D-alanine carboxypeptidase family protein [Aneurinibacillus thermoaerophilus]|nr:MULTISPECIES: D-alanyl-D-alanine carboxypeptidase family protein [Aneurinibacillus]AMA73641.1 peptidase S11 [Aneurinibacillus sp. XH2]